MIPLFRTHIYPESIENVTKVLNSGWLGLGPNVVEFESKFADYIGCKHAVALNSGTAALQLAVELAEIPPASRVISTALTFVATNHVLLQAKLDPIFADIDLLTGNADLGSIRRLCKLYGKGEHNTIRPRAIMAVHYGGHPLPIDLLYEIGEEYRLKIIEDAAHACGAEYQGEKIGKNSRFCCYSFHAVKNLPTGDGGMLVTNDNEVANKARKLRWFGIDKSTTDRSQAGYSWEYNVEGLGYKLHMNDITAAIGLGQLSHLDEDNNYRHKLYTWYKEREIPLLVEFPHSESSHHLIVMIANNKKHKESIMDHLAKNEIQAGCHYTPNYYYPIYKKQIRENNCTDTEDFYNRAISLPNYLDLTENDIDFICQKIKETI